MIERFGGLRADAVGRVDAPIGGADPASNAFLVTYAGRRDPVPRRAARSAGPSSTALR